MIISYVNVYYIVIHYMDSCHAQSCVKHNIIISSNEFNAPPTIVNLSTYVDIVEMWSYNNWSAAMSTYISSHIII